MPIEFTGNETPAEIAAAAIEWFSSKPNLPSITIFYDNSIPKLRYESQGGNADFVCIYRLDKMLESFYSAAENIFNENLRVGFVTAAQRPILLPYIAYSGMTTMLSHLTVLISNVFLETLEGTHLLTTGVVLHSLVTRSSSPQVMAKTANKEVQQWIDDFLANLMKKKREYLAGYMNTHQLFHIPTGVGRPPGSTKPEEQKRADAEEFAREIENAAQALYETTGRIPTKTEIARFLKPGVNPRTGTDSRLSVFSKKVKNLNINYDAIVKRVATLPKN
jgi:hypothetical protein